MFAQQVADLQGAFRSRGWNLTDNEAATLVQMAEAQRQSAEKAADRAQQASQFNSTMSFKRQQANQQAALSRAKLAQSAANSRRAASRAGSGGSSGPEPLSGVQAIELEQAKMDRANEAFSAYGSTGVAPGLKGYGSSGLRSSAIAKRGGPYRAGGAPKPSSGLSDAMNGFIRGWGN